MLNCSNNNLTSLLPEFNSGNKLPESLKKLDCWKNNLISLPELPESLKELNCSCNYITSLPNNLIDLRNLSEIYYGGNEIELTIQQINFI